MSETVVVFVPGIMGSELQNPGGQVVWPGSVGELLRDRYDHRPLLRDDLVATAVIRRVWVSNQYASLIDDLGALGFFEATGGGGDGPGLYLFPYDWRADNRRSAEGLSDFLDRVAVERPGAEVALLAHSMGGLVARYVLESGRFSSRPGFSAVRQLITLGTPHRGAPLALPRIRGEEDVLWLGRKHVRALAAAPGFTAVYQLLPPPGEPFAWDQEGHKRYAPLDIYHPDIAASLGLSAEHLRAAREFHEALDHARRPPGVRYFCFSGTRLRTDTTAWMRSDPQFGYHVYRIQTEGGGDGVVPHWSSALAGVQGMVVGGEHSVIYKDGEVRRALGILLGVPGVLDHASRGWELTVRDRVVRPGEPIQLTLRPIPGASNVVGRFQFERPLGEVPGAGEFDTFEPAGLPVPLTFQGPLADRLQLRLSAPGAVGAYRLLFQADSGAACSDDLFVREFD